MFTLEEDILSFHEKTKNKNEEISNQLQILEKAQEILMSDEIEQKKELLNTIGSNWRIKDKKLLYEPNFISEAIQKAKKSHSVEFDMFEPTESGSSNAQVLSDETVIRVWRGVWELIKNSKNFLRKERNDI